MNVSPRPSDVDDGSRLLGVSEAARVLGIAPFTLRRLIHRGELPAVRIGRRVLLASGVLSAFARARGA